MAIYIVYIYINGNQFAPIKKYDYSQNSIITKKPVIIINIFHWVQSGSISIKKWTTLFYKENNSGKNKFVLRCKRHTIGTLKRNVAHVNSSVACETINRNVALLKL